MGVGVGVLSNSEFPFVMVKKSENHCIKKNKSNSFDDQMSKNIKNGMIPCVLMGYFVISIIVNVIFGDDVSQNDRLTSLISSLACCSLSGLLVNCSLASASRFFCSNI